MIDLSICPFCNSDSVEVLSELILGKTVYYVVCRECSARGSSSRYKSNAAQEWNNCSRNNETPKECIACQLQI